MTLSQDDEPAPETLSERPIQGTIPGEGSAGGGGGGAVDADRRSLTHDLDEVERGRPERAFNVGATLGVLVTVAAVVFVLQNRQSTGFDWLWFDFELPLWTALLGAVGVGVVLVMTVLAVHARRQRRIGRRRDAAGRLRRALGRDHRPAEPDHARGEAGSAP
jgi:uncharacterized integral membrane protein